MPRKLTHAEVVERFREAHGDTYDYSSVVFRRTVEKVTIICRTHGPFQVLPQHHWEGTGCRNCYAERMRIGQAAFIKRSLLAHPDIRFDYSRIAEAVGTGDEVQLRCIAHDLWFSQSAKAHIKGHNGCRACTREQALGPIRSKGQVNQDATPTQQFIEQARRVHGDQYDYSATTYQGAAKRVEILCPTHGAFHPSASNHLRGNGCPRCSAATRMQDTLKAKCKDVGINYHRALKRRQAGMADDLVLRPGYLRSDRAVGTIEVQGQSFPNLEAAVRALKPVASSQTIARQIAKGILPDEAFARVPSPGFTKGIVYLITHRASGTRYVGCTVARLDKRWQGHCEQAATERVRHQGSLHAAIRAYGPDEFTVEPVDTGTSKLDLGCKERHWIRELGTLWPSGYNLTPGGETGGSLGRAMELDGIRFKSVKSAAEHVATTRAVSLHAAKARIRTGRLDVTSPPKPGQGVCNTRAYKAWSAIVHGRVSPASKHFLPGLELHPPWRDFRQFLADVGQPTSPDLVFARRDKSQGFTPENCKWMSRSEAARLSAASRVKRKKST